VKNNFIDEIIAITIFFILSLIIISSDLFETIYIYSKVYEKYYFDEFVVLSIPFSFVSLFYAFKKYIDLTKSKRELLEFHKIDKLTGLENRESFLVDRKIDTSSHVIILNIIDFKTINKTLGFDNADLLLCEISNKLVKSVRKYAKSKLYRLYGDEYAFFYNSDDIHSVCEDIKNDFENNTIPFDKNYFHLSLNIAYSNIEPRFFTATLALQECKKSLDKNIISYDEGKYNKGEKEETLKMLKLLKDSILKDKIVPVYHAIIDNKTDKVSKYETLARIKQENNELLSPFFFIELSKKFKLYPHITKIIIEKAFNDFKDMDYGFSINFSYIDIHNEEILAFFYSKLEENKDTAKKLTIEILETENIGSYSELVIFRDKIKEYGCSLAIDDFGSGYSNWVDILNLQPDYIKIDGSLIQNLLKNEGNINLVKTIVNFAKDNNVKTIAEFVSNEELSILVKKLGIDYSQGFFFAQPELIEDL
jgi:EAL domain-containing protein (putative c-di-GMP-specific phosphodiesterase class I)/GGDEF domain-containing protein